MVVEFVLKGLVGPFLPGYIKHLTVVAGQVVGEVPHRLLLPDFGSLHTDLD